MKKQSHFLFTKNKLCLSKSNFTANLLHWFRHCHFQLLRFSHYNYLHKTLHRRFGLHWLFNFRLIQLPRQMTVHQVAKLSFLPAIRLLLELSPLELRVS